MKTFFGNIAPLPDNDAKPHLMDMVMQLGRTSRFGSASRPGWSVLHHTVLVTFLYMKHYGTDGLHHATFHDLHEAFTGDIPSPVKAAIGSEHVRKVEQELDQRIYNTFGETIPSTDDKHLVKMVDWAALFIEGHYIGPPGIVAHMICCDLPRLDAHDRQSVFSVIEDCVPEVAEVLRRAGYFEAPYQDGEGKAA